MEVMLDESLVELGEELLEEVWDELEELLLDDLELFEDPFDDPPLPLDDLEPPLPFPLPFEGSEQQPQSTTSSSRKLAILGPNLFSSRLQFSSSVPVGTPKYSTSGLEKYGTLGQDGLPLHA